MIKINDTQLSAKLATDESLRYFITVGSDPYLQYFSHNLIKDKLHQLGFTEQNVFSIDNQTDWDLIFQSSQTMSLFSNLTTLILQFGDTALNATITKKLDDLTRNLSSDVSLLISLNKMSKVQEGTSWLKNLGDNLVMINCNTPEAQQLPSWIALQLRQQTLTIEKQGIELLAYYYEGNLLALTQILIQLKLLYPKSTVTFAQLEEHINDSAVFTPYHWIDAMLQRKAKRSMHILQQLKRSDFETLILLRTIQRELILLINIKKYAIKQGLKAAFDTYKVWQSRRNLMAPYINTVTVEYLYAILQKLTEIEIISKNDHQTPVWEQITALNLVFIGRSNE